MQNKKKLIQINLFWTLYVLFFGLLAFGQLQRFQITSSVAIYGHELILALWIFLFAKPIIHQFHTLFLRQLAVVRWMIALLVFIGLQATLFSLVDFQLPSLLYLVRFTFYLLLLPLLKLGKTKYHLSSSTLYHTIIGVGSLIALSGLLQYLFIPDTRFLVYSGWDDHYYRLISTLFDPNFTALILLLTLLTWLSKQQRWSPKAYFLQLPFFLLAILLTYSRAGYVALIGGIVVFSLLTKQWKSLMIVFVLLACIPFLPRPDGEGVKLERTASIESRLESNQRALRTLSFQHMLIGKGLYRDIEVREIPNHATAPDNSFIFIFSSLGIIGSTLLAGVLFQSMKTIQSSLWWSVIASVSIHSLFNNSLFYIWTMVLLILIYVTINQNESTH